MKILRNATLYVLGFGIPLLFLPQIYADAFGLPKFILLILGFCVLLLIWAVTVFQTNTLHWRATPFDVPLAALGGAYLLSTFTASPNKIATLTSPGGAGMVLLLVLLYFLAVQTAGETTSDVKRGTLGETALTGLVHAAVLTSLWTVVNVGMELFNFQFSIFQPKADPPLVDNFQFPLANLSPLGSLLTQAVFLLLVLVYVGADFMRGGKWEMGSATSEVGSEIDESERAKNQKLPSQFLTSHFSLLTSTVILSIGLIATVYKLTQISPFPLLPYQFGWAIALDAFKNAPVFGVGPANFISAFTRFKPAVINTTEYWNVTFGVSSNWYFHVLTTVGALGLIAYLFLVWRVWKNKDEGLYKARSVALTTLAVLALQLFVPFNLPLLFAEFVVLSALGIALSAPPSAIRLVTVQEDLVGVETSEGERVTEVYEEVEVEDSTQI